jgi:hypothetical protein
MNLLASPSLTTKPTKQIKARAADWAPAIVCSVVSAFMFTVLCWGLNKGFDPNVEGFYMLSYQHPDLYPGFSSFHCLLSKVPRLINSEILHYRILEIAARLMPAIALSFSVSIWLQRWTALKRGQLMFTIAFACIGAMMTFAVFPRTISYNGLAGALVCLSGATIFYASHLRANAALQPLNAGQKLKAEQPLKLHSSDSMFRSGAAFFLLSGILCGIAFFVKFTSAVCLLPLLLLFAFLDRRNMSAMWQITLGFAIGCSTYFLFVQNPQDWWLAFSEAVVSEAKSSHKLDTVTYALTDFFLLHWKRCAVLAALAFAIPKVITIRNERPAHLRIAAVVFLFAAGLLYAAYNASYTTRESYTPIFTILLLASMSFAAKPINSDLFRGALLLLALPCVATVGTNCSFLGHVASNMAPWFVLIALASCELGKRLQASYALTAIPIALSLFCSYEFVEQYVFNTPDCGEDLTKQNTLVPELPHLAGIAVTPEQANFYRQMKNILIGANFQAGDPILCLYDLPGLPYVMDGFSPGRAWSVSFHEVDAENAAFFAKADLRREPRLYLAVTGSSQNKVIYRKMREALRKQNLQFSQSFRPIGVVQSPLVSGEKVFLFQSLHNTSDR